MKSDYDGAWKNLVGTHLREVLTLFFPGVAQEIDWRAALAVLAQIAGLETSGSPQRRLAKRLELCQQFLGQGWNKKQIVEAFRLVAWMMRLPRVESLQFREVVSGWEKMKTTLPLTDLEEIWLEEGIEKGIEQGIERGIERGIEKGRQEGEWIGKIELLEKLLGKTQTASVILKKETLKQLQSRFNKLEKEYDAKHRPLDRRASNGPNPNPRKAPSA